METRGFKVIDLLTGKEMTNRRAYQLIGKGHYYPEGSYGSDNICDEFIMTMDGDICIPWYEDLEWLEEKETWKVELIKILETKIC